MLLDHNSCKKNNIKTEGTKVTQTSTARIHSGLFTAFDRLELQLVIITWAPHGIYCRQELVLFAGAASARENTSTYCELQPTHPWVKVMPTRFGAERTNGPT